MAPLFVALVALIGVLPGTPHRHHPGHEAPRHAGKGHRVTAQPPSAVHARVKPAKSAAERVEEVEAVEEVGDVAGGQGAAGDGNGDASKQGGGGPAAWTVSGVLGHLHAAVVHMPIAWLALWTGFEALALVWPHPWLIMAGLPMSVATVLSFAPAVLTGLLRFQELAAASSSYDAAPAHLHRNLLFFAWALLIAACGLRLSLARPHGKRAWRLGYVALVALAFAITGWSAHLGGCMVYGDDFLPF